MTTDADDVSELVDDLHEQAVALGDDAALEEVFTPAFMERHADAGTIEAFLAESPWDVETKADFADVPEAEFDDYVAEATAFPDWDAMMEAAGTEWMASRLGL
jgi:hypothetical protein